MSVCDWSERVALLVDEDDAGTRAHVASCPACAELLDELRGDRDLLRSMPVPTMAFPRVPARRTGWQWVAVAAALLAVAFLWMHTSRQSEEPMRAIAKPPEAPAQPATRPVVERPRVTARTPRPRRPVRVPAHQDVSLAAALEAALPPLVNAPVAAAGDVVVAMQTEDPSVWIVLIGGDSND